MEGTLDPKSTNLVCVPGWRRYAFNGSRILVCRCESDDSAFYPLPVVLPHLPLVSVLMACARTAPSFELVPPRSSWRAWISQCKPICICTGTGGPHRLSGRIYRRQNRV